MENLIHENTPSLLQGLTDSHFHLLSMEQKGLDTQAILQAMENAGFAPSMDIGTEYDDFEVRKTKAIPFSSWLRLSVAAGPWALQRKESIDIQLAGMERTLEENRTAIHALGEIGLDYHWNYGTHELQKELFTRQLLMARKWNLPVLIHNRDADDDILECLRAYNLPRGGVMHCFSSTPEVALKAVELGFYISFAGNVTYKSNALLRETARAIPLDRILTETDSPYLSPLPFRGKVNTPLRVQMTAQLLAAELQMEEEDFLHTVQKNFSRLFD